MPNDPLGDEIDNQIIQRMTKDEQQQTEALAARLRERLAVWSRRFTVLTGDRPFEYRINYQGPSWHLSLNVSLPAGAGTYYLEISNYLVPKIISDFESKLWEKFKDVFEGHQRSNRKLFHDMLWRASGQHYNTGVSDVFKAH